MSNYMPPVAILGGGIAGLTAATQLKHHRIPFILFEGSKGIAGLMKSERDGDGFTYDCGVHFVTNRLAAAVGASTQCQPMVRYGESVHLRDRDYSYPLGLMKSPRFMASALASKVASLRNRDQRSAEQFYRVQYGTKLADEVAIPLTEAWSGCPASEIAASVGQKFATSLPRMMMLRSAAWITNRVIGIGYAGTIKESTNSWHVYPNGGVAKICEILAQAVEHDIQLESKVERIVVADNRVVAVIVNGHEVEVSGAISTAPLHALAGIVSGTERLEPLKRFRYRAMVFVNLKLNGASGLNEVVTWVPEAKYPFFRLSDIGMGLPFLVPAGKSHITCDIGCKVGDETWTSSDETLVEKCLDSLELMVPGIKRRCFGSRVVRVPLAYPIFHLDYEADRQRLEKGTGIDGLLSVGRNGGFAHILMEDVYWRTRWKVSEFIEQIKSSVGKHSQLTSECR
jgi:protoporphyrinogen/coproporphyrinogen III oxidase